MTGFSRRQDSSFGENVYTYILSVVVVKVPTDSKTSPRTQTAVSALVGDRLTASIQVVKRRQSPLSRPSASIQVVTRRQSPLSRPSKTISRVLVLWKYVLRSESTSWNWYMTMLLYICVSLRTRHDTISYSFIYIIQKSEFQDVRTENLRIRKVGAQKTWIEKVGNWTGKQEFWKSKFRKSETGVY